MSSVRTMFSFELKAEMCVLCLNESEWHVIAFAKVKVEVLMSAADLMCKVVKQSSPANVHSYIYFHEFILMELLFCKSLWL